MGNASEILYKYGSWDCCYFRRILENCLIYFPNPSKFNDPFDCKVHLRYDLLSDEEILQSIRYYAHRKFPHFTEQDIEKEARKQAGLNQLRDPDHLKWFRDYYEKETDKSYGIFCLTTDPTSLVMWGNYANKHRGICIGFDPNGFEEHFNRLLQEDRLVIARHAVEYSKKYPILKPTVAGSQEDKFIIEQLTTKSCVWKYEKEVRFISIGKSDIQYFIPKEIIKEIIFGCMVSAETRNEILNLIAVKNYDVQCFEARKLSEDFGLEIIKI
jgi:hypothetical protein